MLSTPPSVEAEGTGNRAAGSVPVVRSPASEDVATCAIGEPERYGTNVCVVSLNEASITHDAPSYRLIKFGALVVSTQHWNLIAAPLGPFTGAELPQWHAASARKPGFR